MAGLDPAIHAPISYAPLTWIPATGAGMTFGVRGRGLVGGCYSNPVSVAQPRPAQMIRWMLST